jgi:hypothetical protein
VNIEIMRAFIRIRQILASHTDLAEKLAALEKKYDAQFKVVFDALRELMAPPDSKKRRQIGFASKIVLPLVRNNFCNSCVIFDVRSNYLGSQQGEYVKPDEQRKNTSN